MSKDQSAWKVEIDRKALKELAALPKPIAARCWEAIRGLVEDPFPQGVRSIEGMDNGYRIRVGMYRIVYSVDQAQVTVLVLRVRHRKDVYRRL